MARSSQIQSVMVGATLRSSAISSVGISSTFRWLWRSPENQPRAFMSSQRRTRTVSSSGRSAFEIKIQRHREEFGAAFDHQAIAAGRQLGLEAAIGDEVMLIALVVPDHACRRSGRA